ncbi:DNA repair protein recN [Parachlamydia acanthamoebae UV-7]|uniref:DNA repair protein RecN n=2 Tax=Parachlamydia acanthamoebae TaxID=83552 RepID=F8L0M5_PARAV|nr:DNA repair protein RecN [Parachlamydia acanthamoebae]KIA77467.1 DNA repair protein RecN [Parachlamydia acanthamoebae]CCB86775.1 DNA repair protein recN [Parachlamydia acanthamoebae UV-7]
MLKHLTIRNLILIENVEIPFENHLNVLSGETGAGKSAIMHALALIAGSRADSSLIRNGADKGSVEAIFDIEHLPIVQNLLEEAGIEHATEEELIVRREISLQGKSRAFINNQCVQQALLKKIGEQLLEMISQHATQNLFSTDHHRLILDLYGSHHVLINQFQYNWDKENVLRKKIAQLIAAEAQRLREIEVCLYELEELNEADLKNGEDEELFAEYLLLSNSEERLSKSQTVYQGLQSKRDALLPLLNQYVGVLEKLAALDPMIHEIYQSCHHARLELQEVAYSMQAYMNKIDVCPERMHIINERLSLINKLKRKYGSSIEEIYTYQEKTKQKLHTLENVSNEIEALQEEVLKLAASNTELCQRLSEQRKSSAKLLEIALQNELRSLNMPKVEFHVRITPQARNRMGDEHIEFFLSPNVGEKEIAIRECASGGELSRLMLALQTLLAGHGQIPTLIFDEIDANIGGETAAIVGEKLKEIGQQHQVLCITHFPQVAQHAFAHWHIFKQEKEGRTYSSIERLDKKKRQAELARMAGKSVAKEPQLASLSS